MTISRVALIAAACILLTGCAPVTGAKSLIALALALVAACGAAWGWKHERAEDRVARKADELHAYTVAHVAQYHSRDEHG